MVDSSKPAPAAGEAAKSAPKPQNPAMKMMGMPNFRFKLPSRNWMIFLTVAGSFTAAIVYDRREKRRAQQKWCDLVAHLSRETLPVEETRRKLTVFLAAPPGDGLRNARDHFKEYVKPILVAAALDYNVVEGRREGDIRAAFAEQIRKQRRRAGEASTVVEDSTTQDVIEQARQAIGVRDEPGPKGDLILGRHTWKEYIRGLHEGWLGPLDPLPQPAPEEVPAVEVPETPEQAEKKEEEKREEEKKPAKPTGPKPAYIAPIDYPSQNLPPSFPQTLDSATPINFPHLLGFLNTPIRIYRYLNQRYVADSIGQDVAAVVLASHTQPYTDDSSVADADASPTLSTPSDSAKTTASPNTYTFQSELQHEEADWHKSVHKKDEVNPDREREWTDAMVLDPRIAGRLQRYVLLAEEQSRAQRIDAGEEYIIGEERPPRMSVFQKAWIKYGYGEDPEVAKKKPIYGNIDGEDA
ncbi:Tim22-complex subunit TIM54 [Aspergillus stella-maris]|uniref:Tim22-complex subunit TIM54 n=1 Tax=Aspergillus stella-maris TaxID=1810926 RepID=UPI003CCCE2D3